MAQGLRVVRGPDWKYGDQDGGEGHLGTVTDQDGDDSVVVVWDMGEITNCRIGANGKHDLRVFDNAPTGIKFGSSHCGDCKKDGFFGMKWNCKVCEGFCLCSVCYTQGKHDEKHEFVRYYAPGSVGEDVPKRSTSFRMRSLGIFPGAKVVRGKHWDRANEDDGKGKSGTVVGFRSEGFADRNCVAVQWESGSCFKYRLGCDGKVDLKCIEQSPGFDYYREHLPLLDKDLFAEEEYDDDKFRIGDKVCIDVKKEEVKEAQKGHGGWTNRMEDILSKIGTIKDFTKSGDVVAIISGNKWILNPEVLRKVHDVKIGDHVKILDDRDTVKLLQRDHGEWVDDLQEVLGKVGKVVRFSAKEDVLVAFGTQTFVFHPGCCVPANEDETLYEITTGKGTAQGRQNIGLGDALGLMLAQMLLGGVKVVGPEEFLQAAAKGDEIMVGKILQANPKLANMVINGTTAINLASHEGHDNVVNQLLNAKANIELKDSRGATPLFAAAVGKKLSTAVLLIKKGANVNSVNPTGRTALHVAARAGTTDIVKLLLHAKCNVNVQDNVRDTPLHNAIDEGHDDVIEILIKTDSIDFKVCNAKGFNILMFAALKDRRKAVDMITSKCSSMVNDQKDDGFTALHIAAYNDFTHVASFLLQSGANIDIACRRGRTPLFYAAHKGFYDMVKLLLDNQANASSKDEDGNTPLHAVLSGNPAEEQLLLMVLLGAGPRVSSAEKVKIASLLLQYGADINDKNKHNKSPIDICPEMEVRRAVVKCAEQTKVTKQAQSRSRPSTGKSERKLFQTMKVQCMSCFELEADITYKPCDHRVHCLQCTFDFDECPVCEREIEKRLDKDKNVIVPMADSCRVQ